MDLRQQLHDAMWVRVLFTLALLMGVLWVQIDHHGVVAGEVLLGVGVVALVNLPMYIVERRLPTRTAAAIIVVIDLALVTAAVIFAGGSLSAVGIFYVWPIVFSAVFLPAWAPYAAAGSRQRRLRDRLGAPARRLAARLRPRGRDPGAAELDAHHRVPARRRLHARGAAQRAARAGAHRQHGAALRRQGGHRGAAATHAGHQRAAARDEREQPRLPPPPGRGGAHPGGARPDRRRDGRAQRLRAHPQPQHRRLRGARASSAASPPTRCAATRSSASSTSPAPAPSATRRSPTRRSAACSRPWRRTASAASSRRRSRPSTSCSAWSACCTAPTRPSPRPPSPPCARSATRWRSSCATSSTTRSSRARTRSSPTSTSSRATSWPR